MTSMDTEDIIVTELTAELDILCDYSDQLSCRQGRAEWALHRVRCGCGNGGITLSCNDCKEFREATDTAVICDNCGAVYAPARHAYNYIEYLDRRS